jgi:hypothetical protein
MMLTDIGDIRSWRYSFYLPKLNPLKFAEPSLAMTTSQQDW